MLEVKALCKSYRGLPAIDNVAFTIRAGEIVGYVGEQRILIAAALLHDPKLLIFDEPLSGLDVLSARLFKDLLQQLAAQGKAILYISHVLEVVELVCHRVIVIAKGRILADAPPSELKTSLALANLESVFAQLVKQQNTQSVAQQLAQTMAVHHV
jgi:ABC-2 type transport system ATP-binding protein